MKENELKINLYPDRIPRYTFKKEPVLQLISSDTLAYSFDKNQNLAFINSNVPLLNGFYIAHTNHYPIRIKPDDIWLLIVQAFSNHVNSNSEELRKYFVNFDGKNELEVKYPLSSITQVDKKVLENFSEQINEQMKGYLGDKILETLTPNFTTSTYDSTIVGKISIMGAFKKYFDYKMDLCGCGIPYIILEGTVEDYEKIISKAEDLKKYEFEWYINRIIPLVKKMVEAKKGKIDVDFFKDFIQKKEVTETIYGLSGIEEGKEKVTYICGWILKFFAYKNETNYRGKIRTFDGGELAIKYLDKLAYQMLIVPFKIVDEVHKKTYLMKYKVGFVGCDQNDKNEVYPIQGWIVSPSTQKDRESIL